MTNRVNEFPVYHCLSMQKRMHTAFGGSGMGEERLQKTSKRKFKFGTND